MTSEQRLQNERNIWIATTRPDGRPHLTPVWFVYLRSRFWVATGAKSVKVKNVRANPSVSVALEGGNLPVVAEGTAHLHEHNRPDNVTRAFADKYGWDITIAEDPDLGEIVLWEISVKKWLFGQPDARQPE